MILDYIIILILILDWIYDFSAFLIFISFVLYSVNFAYFYLLCFCIIYNALLYKGTETFWSALRNKLLLLLSAAILMRDLILVTIVISIGLF